MKTWPIGGRGVARLDGFVIFVGGTVPGDRILARIYKKKKGYAEAGLMELLEASPDRIDPPCPYAGYCGGCQWQHVTYDKQLSFKREHVREPLERIAGLKDVVVHSLLPSENIFGYRNKMEFSFSDRRWYLPREFPFIEEKEDFALGLHVPGTYHKVIHMEACLLQRPNRKRDSESEGGGPICQGIGCSGLRLEESQGFLALFDPSAFRRLRPLDGQSGDFGRR